MTQPIIESQRFKNHRQRRDASGLEVVPRMSTLPSREEVVEKVRRIVEDHYQEKKDKLEKIYEGYRKEIEKAFMEAAKKFPEKLTS